jgi:hypothetical protein
MKDYETWADEAVSRLALIVEWFNMEAIKFNFK